MGLSANSQRRGGLARVLAISFAFLTLLSLLAGLAPRAAAAVDSVDSPVKGDVWTGGATHDIVYTEGLVNGDITPEVGYYVVNGAPVQIWRTIVGYGGTKRQPWTIPAEDLENVTISVCIPGWGGQCAASGAFAIHGVPPSLPRRSPEGANVNVLEPITLTFSDPMNTTAVESGFSLSPTATGGFWTWGANDTTASAQFSLRPGTSYSATLSCGAKDAAGDPGNPVAGCPIVWSFRTSSYPSISFIQPIAGRVWSGGSTHRIVWDATDAEDAPSSLQVTLWYHLSAT